ncbi:MAG: alpha/beta fold hydrolase [Clostridia bacterium]|nr:alpha/beta fold hydrolase [Clostridia bacterium]
MEILKFSVPSSDGVHDLVGKVYLPDGKPKGVVHVLHGMTEHIARYDGFMKELAEAGYLACGYDHLGHGNTAADPSELGFVAEKNGWKLWVADVKVFSDAVRTAYGADLPYILMGHSMGSFIARLASASCVHPDALILMGTGGPNPIAGVGLALIRIVKAFKGSRHISPLLYTVAFGGYNKRFTDGDDPRAWLTKDAAARDKYAADPFCTFRFTVSAMGDLVTLTKNANRGAWFKSLPKNLPILLVSGRDDPVGDFGKGVETVSSRLQKTGHTVTCRLYDGYRHEILNDASHPTVVEDILDFLGAVAVS